MLSCPECQMPLEAPAAFCPSCGCRQQASSSPPVGGRSGTMVENVEELRRSVRGPGTMVENVDQLRAAPNSKTPPAASAAKAQKTAPAIKTVDTSAAKMDVSEESGEAAAFRPIGRPPVLLLCIVDDGQRDEGEWVRVRTEKLTIGRADGDLVVPHDEAMSGRHAEIVRVADRGQFRFLLRDLRSTNGSFIRATRAALRQDQELLIGGRRYRFDAGGAAAAEADTSSPPMSTRAWRAPSMADIERMMPALVELGPAGDVRRIPLALDNQMIGTDATQCKVVIEGDPFVSPRHVRIYKDERQRWMIENLKSLNGLWLRVSEVALEANAEFQLGEQRFFVRFS